MTSSAPKSEASTVDITGDMIFKEIVVGFVITERIRREHASDTKQTKRVSVALPLSLSWTGEQYCPALEDDEETIAILPAPNGCYRVLGTWPNGKGAHELGYEFPGAVHPDWMEELKERVRKDPEGKNQTAFFGEDV